MKTSSALFICFLAAASTNAQQAAVPVQMECHDPSLNSNFIGPDETLVNGLVCHVVKPAKVQNQGAITQQAPYQQQSFIAKTPEPATTPAPLQLTGPINTKIIAGSRVYITPMEGFETYLAAALTKKKVPLIPVGDPALADYVLGGTSVDKKAGWAKIVFMGNIHSDNAASVSMTDKRTGAIVFAYAVDKKSTLHGQQTTAEACAKHLKNTIEDEAKEK